jgi:DNA damage-binding protein 1
METDSATNTLAILHIDHLQRVQLLARDLDIEGLEFSVMPSFHLQCAILPSNSFPDTENPLILVPVSPFGPNSLDARATYCRGGVLVLGGRKIIFVEAASADEQIQQKGKEKRQQQRKTSSSEKAHRQAAQRDKEREAKKVKSRATVKWPWSEVTAYVVSIAS